MPFDLKTWELLAAAGDVSDGPRVALGFDGSISEDETVLYGCTSDGHLFLVGAWSRSDMVERRVPVDNSRAARTAAVSDTRDRSGWADL